MHLLGNKRDCFAHPFIVYVLFSKKQLLLCFAFTGSRTLIASHTLYCDAEQEATQSTTNLLLLLCVASWKKARKQ